MKTSARLKTGQNFKSIKSTTQPKCILSARLDTAPDRISSSPKVCKSENLLIENFLKIAIALAESRSGGKD